MLSAVLIIPASLRDQANALGEAMGWGPDNYSVPLSASGSEPPTHFGLHAWAQPSFAAMLAGVAQGDVPEVPGLSAAQVAEVVGALIVSFAEIAGWHWERVLADNGLQVVT